ncbi:MAG: BLUF domain-containing protein [Alphaproteobacteria bacterium]|nr:BLUF domain-containing protein [Alphaproteobacteria bacterium]
MRQLLYASNTHRDVSDAVLEDILAASRRNNAACDVTGVLIYSKGGFMQVLEGEGAAVSQTYARIGADKRHWNAMVLLDRDAPRAFGAWSMGFERPAAIGEGLFALTREAIAGRLKPDAPAEIMALLQTFYRINAR